MQASMRAPSSSGWGTASKGTPTKTSRSRESKRLLSENVSFDNVFSRTACTITWSSLPLVIVFLIDPAACNTVFSARSPQS